MSDFRIRSDQRERLLAGHYGPLTFKGTADPEGKDPKPAGCEPGARYVLSWRPASVTVLDTETGDCAVTPRLPNWFLTVTKVVRRPDGSWLVRFEVTDRRDQDLFLRRGGGLSSRDELDAGRVPDAEWLERHTDMIASKWTRLRLEKHVEQLRGQHRARRRRAA